uniref:C2H2-type domain-containing protein n=1 Tax=Trichogramma kaykai TaxID=54128 RepID=A0ABD2WTI3_9HYME
MPTLEPISFVPCNEDNVDCKDDKTVKCRKIIRRKRRSTRTRVLPSRWKNYCIEEKLSSNGALKSLDINKKVPRKCGRPRKKVEPKATSKMSVKNEPDETAEKATATKSRRRAYPGQIWNCHNKGCDRKFKYKSNLKRHLSFECQGKRLFSCAYCDFKASYHVNVMKHTISIHPSQNYKKVHYLKDGKMFELNVGASTKYLSIDDKIVKKVPTKRGKE